MKMNIDWKTRLKNPYFWIGLIALFFTTLQIDVSTLTSWDLLAQNIKEFFGNPFLVGSFFIALIGYINNPTTKGLQD